MVILATPLASHHEYDTPCSAKKSLPVLENEKFAEGRLQAFGPMAAEIAANQGRGQPRLPHWDPPRVAKRVDCIVALKHRSQFARHAAESIVNTFSQLQSRVGSRCLMASHELGVAEVLSVTCFVATSSAVFDGCRQAVCDCLRSASSVAYDCSHREQLWKRAPLRLSIFLETSAAVQGILANIVDRIPPSLKFGSLHFSAGPAQWSYDGSASACWSITHYCCTYCPAESGLLPKSIAQSFNAPVATDQPFSPSNFNVTMHQWRSVVRRMVRCKLTVALPSGTCHLKLSGGAFAVAKDGARDRLICNRRA